MCQLLWRDGILPTFPEAHQSPPFARTARTLALSLCQCQVLPVCRDATERSHALFAAIAAKQRIPLERTPVLARKPTSQCLTLPKRSKFGVKLVSLKQAKKKLANALNARHKQVFSPLLPAGVANSRHRPLSPDPIALAQQTGASKDIPGRREISTAQEPLRKPRPTIILLSGRIIYPDADETPSQRRANLCSPIHKSQLNANIPSITTSLRTTPRLVRLNRPHMKLQQPLFGPVASSAQIASAPCSPRTYQARAMLLRAWDELDVRRRLPKPKKSPFFSKTLLKPLYQVPHLPTKRSKRSKLSVHSKRGSVQY